MKIEYGNLFDLPSDGDAMCVTTNGIVKRDGTAVMGAGIAKLFAIMFPDLPRKLGDKLKKHGNHAYYLKQVNNYGSIYHILSFPTKNHYKDLASLTLIEQSCYELVDILDNHYDIQHCYFPLPGCGLGGLKKDEVLPIISKILDDRFILVIKE